MADNYLITGYWGEPHVTAENDRGINAAMFGTGRFVLPVGEQFKAEYIGNNTIRMYDGKLMDNGAAAGIPAGEYVDLLVAEAGQGMNRNDLIVFQYEQDASTLIERGSFVVIKGEETSGTASDPALTQQDLLTNKATFDQMALWRVSISATVISAPVQLFTVDVGGAGALEQAKDHTNRAINTHDTSGTAHQDIRVAVRSAQTVANAAQSTANSKASTATYTVNVPVSWTEDTTNGGYTQTVTVSGILETDNPMADIILGSDIEANALYLEAWGLVTRITTAANSITLYANNEAPATAFTIQLKVVR